LLPIAADAIGSDIIVVMTDVLIRDVPSDDLEEIRSAAAARGVSVQHYLREALHTQAAYVRRQAALARTAERLHGGSAVPDVERQAVLDAVDTAHAERADQITDRSSG